MKLAALLITLETVCLAMVALGEITPTDISGSSGWIGAGLLGLVLGWLLLIHLPAKDKQTRELTEAKDKQIGELITSKDTIISQLATTFRENLQRTIETFRALAQEAQLGFDARTAKSLEAVTLMTRDERANYQKWHEENRSVLHQLVIELKEARSTVLAETKENRHAIVNLRHDLALREAAKSKGMSIIEDDRPRESE